MRSVCRLGVLVKFCLAGWLQCSCLLTFAQVNYSIDQSIGVEVNGKPILMPWSGGLNSAQINTIDLNQDGKDDLAVFDRTANQIFTYLNVGNQYIYAPDYEAYFPSVVSDWMLLRDFNCDGKKDLFTTDPGGIAVFVNITKPGGLPAWRAFNPGYPLLTIGYNSSINLQMNATDIPAIDDIDEDGDLDIIVARFVGFGSMEFHRNMSIENTGHCDSLQLKRITTEWGNFEECNCGLYAFDGKDCNQLIGGRALRTDRVLHDAGKSLLTLDLNDDGLHDLIFSEQNCTSLYLLPNQGIRDSAQMNNYSVFPAVNPSTLLFPASFYEDLDFDGVKDLIVSTNISARVTTDIDLTNSIWFYKNSGTNSLPQFDLKKTNLLQDQMVDAGSYASPAFADYDNDGDQDLFISYWAIPDSVASIYQYENTGSFYKPAFSFVTNDYVQFSQFGLFNIKIQFADANSDGKKDLVFTATDKLQGITQLYFIANKSALNFDFSGQSPEVLGFTIDPLENVLLYDVNRDGLLDIILGKSDGSLQYWKNNGSANVMQPVLVDNSYLGLGSTITRFCVSPTVSDLKHDGKPDLLLGNYGSIVIYSDFQTGTPTADSVFVNNQLKNTSLAANLSSYLTLTTADLYSDFNPLVIAGTITGGIRILKPDSTASNQQENSVSFWPNPVNLNQKINVRASQNSTLQFFDVLGQKINDPVSILGGEATALEQTLSAGLYIVRVSSSGKTTTIKLIVH